MQLNQLTSLLFIHREKGTCVKACRAKASISHTPSPSLNLGEFLSVGKWLLHHKLIATSIIHALNGIIGVMKSDCGVEAM